MERKMRKFLTTAAVLVALTSTAAATVELSSKRCNDGDPNCYIINVYDRVNKGDDDAFTEALKTVRGKSEKPDIVIVLNSPGGDFQTGMAIARKIKKEGLATLAAQVCTSVCAVIWLSGPQRQYLKESSIGFHGVFSRWMDAH